LTASATEAAPQLGGPLSEFLAEQIPRSARAARAKFPAVPLDDYEQGAWLEVLSRPHRFRDPFDRGDLGLVRKRLYEAALKVGQEDDRYRRSVKAASEGYATDDIAFYSTGLIGKLLPVLVEADFDVSAAMQRASSGVDAAGVFIRSNDPHGGAENYQVMLLDVSVGWKRLTAGQRRLLRAYYSCNQEDTQEGRWERDGLAASMGLTGNALRVRVHRALERLQEELGGADPWRRAR
jgi:hypothetical protein